MSESQLVELLEGARNCVQGYTQVKAHERVLVWCERSPKVDQLVLQALLAALDEVNAEILIIHSKPSNQRLGGSLEKPLVAAMKESDVIISLLELENCAVIDNYNFQKVLFEKNQLRCTSIIATAADLLASDWAKFPSELLWGIFNKVIGQAKSAKNETFHLTAPNGTDLIGKMQYKWGFNKIRPPAKWHYFPGGDMAEQPILPVDGTLVWDQMEGFKGFLSKPIKLSIKDSWVTKVEGGYEAKWLEKMMKRFTNGNYFCETTIGAHPKAPIGRGLEVQSPDTLLYRHSGTYHGAVGRWGEDSELDIFSEWHWDGGMINPTLYIGDTKIVDNGRLIALDDPDLKKQASKYGNPDSVLEEVYWPTTATSFRNTNF